MKKVNKYFILLISDWQIFIQIKKTSDKNNMPKEKLTTIKIAGGQFPSPLIIAEEKGYFVQEGIRVQKENIPNLNLTIESLARGDIDVASINYSTLFAFQNISPNKFKVFFGSYETKENPYTLLIAKNDIKKPSDLEGKKIAIRTGVHSEIEAKAVLKGMGLDLDKIEFVVGETSFLITALRDQTIFAVMAPETFATVIVEKGLGKILVKAPRAEYIFDPYPTAAGVVSEKLAKNNPDLVRRIKRAVDKAIDFMDSNEQESRKIFQKALNLDVVVASSMNWGKNSKLENLNKQNVEKLIDFQVNNQLLKGRPDFSNVYLQK